MPPIEHIQSILEIRTRKWWFFTLLIVLQFVVPPYASKGFDFAQWGDIIHKTLGSGLYYSWKPVFPIFQVIPIGLIVLLFFLKNRVARIFAIYAAISYVLITILQNIAVTPTYGVSVVSINILMFLLVAGSWFWEAVVGRNDFSQRRQPFWKYLVISAAVFAFWCPFSQTTGGPDFDPMYLLTSGSGLAFCLMTPVYLAVLIFFYPRVNLATLRVTGAIGTIIGLWNVIPKLLLRVSSTWWDGILHLPLLTLSILGVVLSMRSTRDERHNQGMNTDTQ